jgi:hypothetical protein
MSSSSVQFPKKSGETPQAGVARLNPQQIREKAASIEPNTAQLGHTGIPVDSGRRTYRAGRESFSSAIMKVSNKTHHVVEADRHSPEESKILSALSRSFSRKQ